MRTTTRSVLAWAAVIAVLAACGTDRPAIDRWTPAADFGPGYSGPWIGADGEGRVIVAWGERTGDVQTFWATRLAEGSWSRPEALGRTAHPTILGSGALTVRRDGTALFAWIDGEDQAFSDVVARRFHPARGWAAAERSARGEEVFLLYAASDRLAHDVLAWSSFQGVWAWRNVLDGGVGGPEHVASFLGLPAVVSRVLANGRGEALIAWHEALARGLDAPTGLRASRFDPGQGWSPPEWVVGPEPRVMFERMSMDADGNVLVVYSRYVASSPGPLLYKRGSRARGFSETGNVEGPEYALGDLSPGGDGAAVALLWQRTPDGRSITRLWTKAYDPRTGWGPTEALPDADSSDGFAGATLARAPGDRTFALWQTRDAVDVRVWARELGRNVDARVGLEDEPCNSETPTPFFGQLVFDLAGRGTAAWISCRRLKVSRFE